MKNNEIAWEYRIFKLISIFIIMLGFLVLRALVGIDKESIFMQAEIPEMVLALFSSLLILTFEVVAWYIFRVKGTKGSIFFFKKR